MAGFSRLAVVWGLALSLGAWWVPGAPGHSLGVMVNTTSPRPGGKATVYLAWGHALPVDELIAGESLSFYRARTPGGDSLDLKVDERSLQANEFAVVAPGVYQFEAGRRTGGFTIYRRADGTVGHVIGPKSAVKLEEGDAIERSLRSRMYAKAVVVAGKPEGTDATAGPLGHELEIVPLTAPGRLLVDGECRFRVLFRGEPLSGARVSAIHVGSSPTGAPTATVRTDVEGVAVLEPTQAGMWMLATSHAVANEAGDGSEYDQESFSATLTVGVVEEGLEVEKSGN